jgi:hypothetical protein
MRTDEIKMPEGVRLLEVTPEKLQKIWGELSKIDGLFDDYSRDRMDIFLRKITSPDTVWLERTDGNGLLYLTSVLPNLSATGHLVYWDRKLRGREKFTIDCLAWLVQVIPLEKVNLYLPDFAKIARSFAKRVGFVKEGCIRNWSYNNEKLFNMYIYGMTRVEVLQAAELAEKSKKENEKEKEKEKVNG